MYSVLVVDDDPAIRGLVGALLSPLEYTTTYAVDGNEALALAHEGTPDVIILDVMMPGLDGIEVCNELKIDPRTAHIPIVLLTARSGFEDRVRGEEARADAYLTKPFSPFSLLKTIEHLLDLAGKRQPQEG